MLRGVELLARAQRPVWVRPAFVLAERGSLERPVEESADGEGSISELIRLRTARAARQSGPRLHDRQKKKKMKATLIRSVSAMVAGLPRYRRHQGTPGD